MDPTDNTGKARTPKQATGTNHDTAKAASSAATDRAFGPDGATILATEHWSLLGTRSMIWNEAMSRTTVFLTVLSASIVALSLLANATGFGRHTTTLALVLLPVVFLLGLATYLRLVEINSEDVAITRAMNRLRYAYLVMAPGLRPYFTAGRYDDERGIATTYMLGMRGELQTWSTLSHSARRTLSQRPVAPALARCSAPAHHAIREARAQAISPTQDPLSIGQAAFVGADDVTDAHVAAHDADEHVRALVELSPAPRARRDAMPTGKHLADRSVACMGGVVRYQQSDQPSCSAGCRDSAVRRLS
jgi:hypothetical protein